MHPKTLGSILLAGFVVLTAPARDAMQVESTYLGDGWFEYRVRTLDDPFIKKISLQQLAPWWGGTNFVAAVPPVHWTNFYPSGVWRGIQYDGSEEQPRLQEVVFQAKSSLTNFCRKEYVLTTIIGVTSADPYVLPGGAGGYINFGALVPCAPNQADGSPSNIVVGVELVPDIKIDELITTDGEVRGVKFSWVEESTVQLEASPDMTQWTSVARFFGNPGQTTWTTNAALNPYGNFFRLSLISNRHFTNTLSRPAFLAGSPPVRDIPIHSQQITEEKIQVSFPSFPDTRYAVTCQDWAGQIKAAQQVMAASVTTSVSFDLDASSRLGLFRVQQLAK